MHEALNEPAIVPMPLLQSANTLLAEVERDRDADGLRHLAAAYRSAAGALISARPPGVNAATAEAFAQAYLALARRAEQRFAQAAIAAGAVLITTPARGFRR
jgi:hypothetical protein